jgi:hypothetical protein
MVANSVQTYDCIKTLCIVEGIMSEGSAASAIPSFFVAGNFATSDTYLDPEILVLRVMRHRILRRDHR